MAYYLGHSAWAVETAEHFLLFDCQDINARSGGLLTEGYVDFTLLAGKPVYVFYSHRHHDHYSRKLHNEGEENAQVFTILGGFTSPITKNTATLRPRETQSFNGITVHTAASTDEGVCFLIQADGMGIFFAGDHADWDEGEACTRMYREEIDYIAGLRIKVDAAFIPVCTYSGQRPARMTEGAVYAIERLQPKTAYPMHANGREELYKVFERDLRKAGNPTRVICAEYIGQVVEKL